MYERFGLNSNLFTNGEEIRLVAFQKGNQAYEKRRVAGAAPELVCLDSGQCEEPLRPPFVGNCRRKCGQSESIGVVWRLERHCLDSQANG